MRKQRADTFVGTYLELRNRLADYLIEGVLVHQVIVCGEHQYVILLEWVAK